MVAVWSKKYHLTHLYEKEDGTFKACFSQKIDHKVEPKLLIELYRNRKYPQGEGNTIEAAIESAITKMDP